MKKLLILEFKHCFDRLTWKIVFTFYLVAIFSGYILCVQDVIGKNYQFVRSANEKFILQGTEATFIAYFLKCMLPFLAVIIWALSKQREEKANSAILLIQRQGNKCYVLCKAIVLLSVTFLVITIPLILNLILCHLTFSNVGYDSVWNEPAYLIGGSSYATDLFADLLRLNHPLCYNLLYIFNYGLFGAGLALLGYGFSFLSWTKDYYYVKIPAIIFVIYTLQDILFSSFGCAMFTIPSYLIPGSYGNWPAYFIMLALVYGSSYTLIRRGIHYADI